MQIFFRLIRRLSARTTQFVLGVLASFWGIWILLPLQTFEASLGFNPMAAVVPEFWWGIFLTIVGIATITTIFDNPYNYSVFSFGLAAINLLFWGFVFVSFLLFDSASTSVPTYFTILLTAFLNYVKLYVEEDEEQLKPKLRAR